MRTVMGGPVGPRLGPETLLRVERRGHRVGCRAERGDDAVALALLGRPDAAVTSDDVRQDRVVPVDGLRHRLRVRPPTAVSSPRRRSAGTSRSPSAGARTPATPGSRRLRSHRLIQPRRRNGLHGHASGSCGRSAGGTSPEWGSQCVPPGALDAPAPLLRRTRRAVRARYAPAHAGPPARAPTRYAAPTSRSRAALVHRHVGLRRRTPGSGVLTTSSVDGALATSPGPGTCGRDRG